MSDRPRILVTGFSVFPGAAANPTEALVRRLAGDPPDIGGSFRAEVLLVEYGSIGTRLEAIAQAFQPDIAIHFGLARNCSGFRLERMARNEIRAESPDNLGYQPQASFIHAAGAHFPSTLPLEAIEAALDAAGLPSSLSDDAGGYLCNYLFYLSASPHFPAFSPVMSGFVHVPPLTEDKPDAPGSLTMEQLDRGARIIIATCAQAWRAKAQIA